MKPDCPIQRVRTDAFTVPTSAPESDGTVAWDSSTLDTVRVDAGGCSGLGYTYGHRAVAVVIAESLAPLARGRDAFDTAALHGEAVAALRNIGHPGLGAMAVSALDVALWDLKARLLQVSLPDLLGAARDRVPVYGSGGFTSYDDVQRSTQLSGWIEQGIDRVKMKIGRAHGDRQHARPDGRGQRRLRSRPGAGTRGAAACWCLTGRPPAKAWPCASTTSRPTGCDAVVALASDQRIEPRPQTFAETGDSNGRSNHINRATHLGDRRGLHPSRRRPTRPPFRQPRDRVRAELRRP
ncbi:hypothetical protein [Lysobacter sp. D1-1-M9]|uniref:hypothetical protein n=1 Tax=Novilysobacter longmucuonensis TaxID=3098603 RepID=UPI002FC6CA18